MDDLILAKALSGSTSIEEKAEAEIPNNASIVYMIAVTSSANGEVILRNETEEDGEWAEGDFTEVDEDGDFEEVEEETEEVDDSVLDLTDGDGADIEGSETNSVVAYQTDAVAAYAETISEEESDVVEDDLSDDDSSGADEIDDGDATEIPDDGEGEAVEDEITGDEADVDEVTDDEYTLTDSTEDDESDVVEGAEISDGNTVAECIGSIKAGDRVAVMVQNGKMVVVGAAGSGDETEAEVKQIIEDLKVTNLEVENLNAKKADIDLANIKEASIKTAMIDDAQITTAKIKAGAITDATIHEGAITTAKIADAAITNAKIDSLDAGKIKSGEIETERLILVDKDTGKRSVITALNEEAKNMLDGAVIQEKTIEAAKIKVADLEAFGATIGGFTIDSSSIHSKKTAINDPTAGVFIGTTGIGVGDGNAHGITGSPFEVYADGTVKMRGKNGSIMFDPVSGNIDIVATNFSIGTSAVVVSTAVTYQAGTSGTTAPTGTWKDKLSEIVVADGEYLWTRTITTYSDDTIKEDYVVSQQGGSGGDGGDAIVLTITSSNGNVFQSSDATTVLTAHVFVNGVEQTIASDGTCAYGVVKWYLGETLKATANTLTVSASEVTDSAVYTVQLE